MSKRLYVGNLPFSVTEDELRTMFSQYGDVESVELVVDRMSGRPRGFGFVQMAEEAATAAISGLNGTELGGRNLDVNEARERSERSGPRPQRRERRAW